MKQKIEELVGKIGDLAMPHGLQVHVLIQDVRESFGRTDVRITPKCGAGETWVSLERITLHKEQTTQ